MLQLQMLQVASTIGAVPPNIVFVLTDDEDTMLGGDSALAMPGGLPALSRRGATAANWFVSTPVCAVSRAEILTGRFYHNLKDTPQHGDPWDRRGNTFGPCFAARPGGGCGGRSSAPGRNMHLNFTHLSPGPTVFQHLASAGYTVGVFGKYLNRIPMRTDGTPQIPTGVSEWFVSPGDEANKATELDSSGEYYPEFYYHNNGTWNNTAREYETNFLGNRSVAWMRKAAASAAPFFMYLAPHSPHGMALPAPRYASLTINATSPRTPSWNYSAPDHHWLISQQKPLAVGEAKTLDTHFQKRWRCLRATDDLLAELDAELERLNLWGSTYLFFTSDHGYHFGELRLGGGKWNVYDHDVRVPMRIVGPSIVAGSMLGLVGSHVDLAPTWLALAGISATPEEMDGRSLASALQQRAPEETVKTEETGKGSDDVLPFLPVGSAYLEYHGLGPTGASSAPWFRQQDALNNTYRALRVIDRRQGGLGNVLFSEFGTFDFTTINSREFFEMDSDPWQMHNVYSSLSNQEQMEWAQRVASLYTCSGASCRMAQKSLLILKKTTT